MPPSGAHSLSDSDPGCKWDSGVWRARWRLHQPATKKTEAGKDEFIFPGLPPDACKAVVLFVFQKRKLCALHYPALSVLPEETANVSGAGDRWKKFYLIYLVFPVLLYTPTLSNLHLYLRSNVKPKPDCSLAGALIAGLLQRRDTDSCVRMGLLAAKQSLVSSHPIAVTLNLDSVDPTNIQPQQWAKPRLMYID